MDGQTFSAQARRRLRRPLQSLFSPVTLLAWRWEGLILRISYSWSFESFLRRCYTALSCAQDYRAGTSVMFVTVACLLDCLCIIYYDIVKVDGWMDGWVDG
jgi:hypothetical protein